MCALRDWLTYIPCKCVLTVDASVQCAYAGKLNYSKLNNFYGRIAQKRAPIKNNRIENCFCRTWLLCPAPNRWIFMAPTATGSKARWSWAAACGAYSAWWRHIVAASRLQLVSLRAKLSGAVYCNRSCPWICLCVCVCLWVCYHDNSKLRASILAKLGL